MEVLNDIKEYQRLKILINKIELTLNNDNFINKAPVNIVNLEKEKLTYNQKKVSNIIDKIRISLIESFNLESINWFIQYEREKITELEYCSIEWFNYIYKDEYSNDELIKLYFSIYK